MLNIPIFHSKESHVTKKTIIFILGIMFFCVFIYLIIKYMKKEINVVVYKCTGNKIITSKYKNKNVDIELSDGRRFSLFQTVAASGIRFKNKNYIFWSKSNTAFFEEDGLITYSDCDKISKD